MSRPDALRGMRDATSVKFMKFMRMRSASRSLLICFFEGEDQKYYGIRLDMAFPKLQWGGIDCGGKQQVLELHTLITGHETYKNSPVAFFVDRDFDEPLPEVMRDVVYETPCYSIENFYCEEATINAVLAAEYKVDEFDEDPNCYRESIARFQKLQREYHAAILPINAWIKAHRMRERRDGVRHLNLNNISLSRIVDIGIDEVRKVLPDDRIPDLFPDCYELTAEEVREAQKGFEGSVLGNRFRGKLEIEFLRVFLFKLKEECQKEGGAFYKAGRSIKLQLTKANLISELSQYAVTPACLRAFIGRLATQQAAT
jgi:hypothetical protein